MATKLLAFTDFETDGLEYLTLEPLELTVKLCFVGEDGLIHKDNILLNYSTLIQPLNPDWAKECDPYLSEVMHVENGLIADFAKFEAEGIILPTLEEADSEVHRQLEEIISERYAEDKVTIFMAGTGVASFDRPLVTLRMPLYNGLLYHRPVDMSVTRESLERMGIEVGDDNPLKRTVAHRSEDDVDQSIDAFNYFSRHIRFVA